MNHRQFELGFQWIRMTITIQIRFQVDNQVDDHNFDLFLINFWLKSIIFNPFWLKYWNKLIKRLKESIKRLKKSIKRLKKSIFIKKVDKIWLFRYKSIIFDLFSIKVDRIWSFWYNLDMFQSISSGQVKIWLQIWILKVIKSCWKLIGHDISQFGDLDQLHCQSLIR